MRVLVVDDDESIRSALTLTLSVEECVEVRSAAGGSDALRLVKSFHPDVIVMDYWMPGMDGSEVARALRIELPDARIVAFSGILFEKPDWADAFILKDRLPDAAELLSSD
ncbi:MAG: response regulator [Actinomycetota bacterium]